MAEFTREEILKIKAVVLYILQQFPSGIDYIHLFKIMYFAQRQHLATYGIPLIQESFDAHKNGPVPEYTYRALRTLEGKCSRYPNMQWVAASISITEQCGHPIFTLKEGVQYDHEELSVSNTEILDLIIRQCKDMPAYALSDISHEDEAYRKAWERFEQTGENSLMPMVEIAAAGGASDVMQNIIRERLLVQNALA